MRGKTQKYTTEEVKKILDQQFEYELIGEYVNHKTQIIVKDKIGYLYNTLFGNILNGHKPYPFNIDNKYTIENLRLFIQRNLIGFKLLDIIYKSKKDKINLIDEDGFLYQSFISDLKNNHKPVKFHPSNSYTIFNIKLWIIKNNKSLELISNSYISLKSKLTFRCMKETCKEQFEMSMDDLLYKNCSCPYCSGHWVGKSNCLANKMPEIAKYWNNVKNEISAYEITCGSSSQKYWWICDQCGYEWESTVLNKKNSNTCPNCTRSVGEGLVYKYLKKNNYFFDDEYPFNDLLSPYGNPLRFDFAVFTDENLSDLFCLIEFDGEGHYSNKPFGNISYIRTKQNDKLKDLYCTRNNIKLIRIPFWLVNNIDSILEKELPVFLQNTNYEIMEEL